MAAALFVGGATVAVSAVLLAGPAAADSGSFGYSCDVTGYGPVVYTDQVQGSIPPDLTAGTSFSVSGLEMTATSQTNLVPAGDTVSGSVTTTLDAIGATPSSQTVTLDITPIVIPPSPAVPTYVLTASSSPTFTATGGQVVISTGPTVSAFDISVNGVEQEPFSCTGPSPGAAIAYSSPTGALVANTADNTVSVVDATDGLDVGTIPVGTGPTGVAITPNGEDAYVADSTSNAVSVIDTATGTTVGAPIAVGQDPVAVAVAPDGQTAYVVNHGSGTVTPITLSTGKAGPSIVLSAPPGFPSHPTNIAITPNGQKAYVIDDGNDEVHVLDLTTDPPTDVADPQVSYAPSGVAVSPDGSTVYVGSESDVASISTATNAVGSYIALGPSGSVLVTALALSPDGSTLCATTSSDSGGALTCVATSTDTVGSAIALPGGPTAVAFGPDGATAYVTLAGGADEVVPVTVATGTVGSAVDVGSDPSGLAMQPDQAPVASLAVTPNYPGDPSTFDASLSSSTTSPIASYTWNFGDGSPPQTTTTATTTYAYAAPGTYVASVTVTDTAGTSTAQTFTGQTVSNSGSATATASQQVVIQPCQAGDPCNADVSSPTETSDLSGTSSTDALLAVSIGQEGVSCGTSSPTQTQEVTTYATTNFTASDIEATLVVADLATTRGFVVCYDSTTSFVDAQGQSVTSGELPSCSASSPVPPCVVSATEESGSVVAVLDLLPGDPRFWTPSALTVSSFAPTSAAVGGKVTIAGSGLSGASEVLFGKAEATFTAAKNGKKIVAVVPSAATDAPITVVESQGTAVSSTAFSLAKPTIDAVSATPGQSVTIKGKNLSAVSQVTFGGLVSTSVTKDSAKSVTVVVPAQATSGTVTVVTPGGTATATFTADS